MWVLPPAAAACILDAHLPALMNMLSAPHTGTSSIPLFTAGQRPTQNSSRGQSRSVPLQLQDAPKVVQTCALPPSSAAAVDVPATSGSSAAAAAAAASPGVEAFRANLTGILLQLKRAGIPICHDLSTDQPAAVAPSNSPQMPAAPIAIEAAVAQGADQLEPPAMLAPAPQQASPALAAAPTLQAPTQAETSATPKSPGNAETGFQRPVAFIGEHCGACVSCMFQVARGV